MKNNYVKTNEILYDFEILWFEKNYSHIVVFLYMCMLFFFKLLLFDKITRALRLESLKCRGYLCLKKHFYFLRNWNETYDTCQESNIYN